MNTDAGTRVSFLDLDEIESRQNVVQTVCQATKHPDNPVLPLGAVDEWDSAQASPWASRTVIYDEDDGIYKCWYSGTDLSPEHRFMSGYAVSHDGVVWEKPRLGLIPYQGRTDNNICHTGWGPVLKDTLEPDPERRYKMLAMGEPKELRVRLAISADGIHWTDGPGLDMPEWQGRTPDQVVLLLDHRDPDPQRRYKFVWQALIPAAKPGPERARAKFLAYGPDVQHLTASPANPILSPNDGLEQENHFLALAPYGDHYVMLYEYGWYMPNGTGNFGSYSADIRLAVSRDGENFTRVQPHQKVIARGARGDWDDGFLVIPQGWVETDDEIRLYYCGLGEAWTGWPKGNKPETFSLGAAIESLGEQINLISTGSVRLARMGLATLRRDGFTCLETADRETPGFAVTTPIDVTDPDVELVVNAGDVQPQRSWIEVEVLDAASGEPVQGFGRDDCRDVVQNAVRVPVRWGQRTLADLESTPVRLRFWLMGAARLYAFGFEGR